MSWWRDAVIYQIYPRSFADADGDGIGDLPGITAHLDHVAALGADAVWLSPFYVSPQADAGYDVADYRDVDPMFGTLADADALLDRARTLGLKVIVDLVPNHTSDQHAWFQEALAAGPGSPLRHRYVFRPGRGVDGALPPNDWRSVFGGPAWTRITEPDGTPGPWYLHLFDSGQPDLDWTSAEVRQEFEDILRFWLDRGVDGFRVDVAHGLVKDPALPDWDEEQALLGGGSEPVRAPMWDQEGVHDIFRAWHDVLAEYDEDRILVAEAWVKPLSRLARYVRSDEMHQAFNFDYLETPWRAADQRRVIEASLDAFEGVGAPSTWVLSNHDVVRHATRLALPADEGRPNGIGPDDPQPDLALGLRRARAATLLMLALPGSAYVYQGEELGLPEHTTLPPEVRQDPTFIRTEGKELGRDGCRIPMPWHRDAPALGFSPTGRTWLPQPEVYADLAVDQQDGVAGSTLELYRRALRLRRRLGLGAGTFAWRTVDDAADLVTFTNGATTVLANLGDTPLPVPAGHEVVLASDDLVDVDGRPAVPTDVTAWLA